jgi:hypothetical protein
MLERNQAVRSSFQIPGQSWPRELFWMYDTFSKSSRHAEIGVYCGRSLFASCAGMSRPAKAYAVERGFGNDDFDKNLNPPSMQWHGEVLQSTIRSIGVVNEGVSVELITDVSSSAAMKLWRDRESLDSVYIDASHTYEDVLADIGFWRPIIRPGGIISGHDYWPCDIGVMDAVNEAFGRGFKTVPETRIWFAEV